MIRGDPLCRSNGAGRLDRVGAANVDFTMNQGGCMRGVAIGLAGFLIGALGAARVASAQGAEFSLGAGASVPLSNFGDVAKTGYHGLVGVSFAPSSFPLGFQIDGQYHRLKQDANIGNRTNQIIMGTGNLIYKFKTSED